MVKAGRKLRTWALSAAAGLIAAPVAAAERDMAAWVAANTDLPAAQVVIAGPDYVYSLEPLGARTPAGEVVALVRTEAVDRGWSWDAHLLFDCTNRRLREIRSATYPKRNRKGAPETEPLRPGWVSPKTPEPAARLLAAACDAGFDWALRPTEMRLATMLLPPPGPATVTMPPPTAPVAPTAAAKPAIPTPGAPLPPAATPPAPAVTGAQIYSVQVARGSSQDGALRALKVARKTLGDAAGGLTDTTEVTAMPAGPRYTTRLAGFTDMAAAAQACRTLAQAGQDCFARQDSADAPPPPPLPPMPTYVVQVAMGPSEDGAQRALTAARKVLADSKLTARTLGPGGPNGLYTALLGGFSTAGEAARACATLTRAGQVCFARPAEGAD